jgi:branched-chain amino acid aminotransferase
MNKRTVIFVLSIITILSVYRIAHRRYYINRNNQYGFGQVFTDHMFIMEWNQKKGWHHPRIKPYRPFSMNPASLHMHYGQEIFEGMKAFYTHDNNIALFRPEDHLNRFNQSAQIMCMPEINTAEVSRWLKKLIETDSHWVPNIKGQSLYIRPTMIATEETINLKPSANYTFFVLLSPVGSFYEKGFTPIDIMVSDTYTRSSVGGVGVAKTGGNYAASMRAQVEAHQKGYSQVLWLDPVERKFVEEVGTMNIFFVIDNTLVTPMLTGTILPGITRKTVIEIAKQWNMPVSERKISIDEVIHGIKTGKLTEAFGTGTAVGIAPIGSIAYKNNDYSINERKTGATTHKIYSTLMDIQHGNTAHDQWLVKI